MFKSRLGLVFSKGLSGVSLEAGYRRYTAVFVVTNLPLTAGYCGLIFTQTLILIAAYFD